MRRILVFSVFCAVFILFASFSVFAQEQQEGNATWYQSDSGNMYASHARLALGTRLKVTCLENNKVAYVTVSNRIPIDSIRILDLSQAAAEILGMTDAEYMAVRIEVVRDFPNELVEPVVAIAEPVVTEPVVVEAVVVEPVVAEPIAEIIEPVIIDPIVAIAEPVIIEPVVVEPVVVEPVVVEPVVTEVEIIPTEPFITITELHPAEENIPEVTTVVTPPVPQPPVRTVVPGYEETLPAGYVTADPPPPVAPVVTVTQTEPGSANINVKISVNINGTEHTMEFPSTITEAPPRAEPAVPVVPAPVIPPAPVNQATFRIQVGAFNNPVFAQDAFDRVRRTGYTPSFERHGSLYRVVISGVKASDVIQTEQRLESAGFSNLWIREE